MCLNASAVFRQVPVGKAACDEMMPGPVIPQTILGCDTAHSGWNCPRPSYILPSHGFHPCYKCCASLWIAPCFLCLGVNHNSLEKAPNAIQATLWMRKKKTKTTSGFPPKHNAIGISNHPKRLGDQANLVPQKQQRSKSPQRTWPLSLSLVLC